MKIAGETVPRALLDEGSETGPNQSLGGNGERNLLAFEKIPSLRWDELGPGEADETESS